MLLRACHFPSIERAEMISTLYLYELLLGIKQQMLCSAKTHVQQNDPRILLLCRLIWDFCCQRNRWRPGTRHSHAQSGDTCWSSSGARLPVFSSPEPLSRQASLGKIRSTIQILFNYRNNHLTWSHFLMGAISVHISFPKETCRCSHFIQEKTKAWKT